MDKKIRHYMPIRGLGAYLLYNLLAPKIYLSGEETPLYFSEGPADGPRKKVALNELSPQQAAGYRIGSAFFRRFRRMLLNSVPSSAASSEEFQVKRGLTQALAIYRVRLSSQ